MISPVWIGRYTASMDDKTISEESTSPFSKSPAASSAKKSVLKMSKVLSAVSKIISPSIFFGLPASRRNATLRKTVSCGDKSTGIPEYHSTETISTPSSSASFRKPSASSLPSLSDGAKTATVSAESVLAA